MANNTVFYILLLTLFYVTASEGISPNDFKFHRNGDLLNIIKTVPGIPPILANNELNRRTKVQYIRNGDLEWDNEYFSAPCYQINATKFEKLSCWQPNTLIGFGNYNDMKIGANEQHVFKYMHITVGNNGFAFNWGISEKIAHNTQNIRNGVIIPTMPDVSINIVHYYKPENMDEIVEGELQIEGKKDIKLVLVFENRNSLSQRNPNWSAVGRHILKSTLSSNAYVFFASYNVSDEQSSTPHAYSIIFSGRNVEASIFRVETTNDKMLGAQLLKWKNGLHFLGSHQIVAFYINAESSKRNEKIFENIFSTEPLSLDAYNDLRIAKSTKRTEPIFIVIGFKRF